MTLFQAKHSSKTSGHCEGSASLQRAVFFSLISMSVLGFSACAPELGPEVMRKEEVPSLQKKVYYLKINGSFDNSDGEPIPGAKVLVESSQGEWQDITTHKGTFRTEVIFREGESLEFHFTPAAEVSKNRRADVSWKVRVYDHELPKDSDHVTIRFLKERSGQVRIASMEY